MIVRYPTGLYSSVLPRGPQQAGNVTFTISSTQPPRTSLLFPKLPPGVSGRRRTPRVIDVSLRRKDVDNLLFTVNSASRGATSSSVKQYEVGQILEFGDLAPTRTLEPNTAGCHSEIRHDTGLLDYQRLGITPDQRALVEREGDEVYRRLEAELAAARQLYSDLQVAIGENQKLLTETGKALDALRAMGSSDPTIAGMISDLADKRQALNSGRGGLVNRANDAARLAAGLLQQLRDLSQVIR